MTEVSCLNRALKIAMTDDGQMVAITDAFDSYGDDCDIKDAVSCVAGPDRDGNYLSINLRWFEGVSLQ